MRYEFGSFAFDTEARQLTSGGREVRLSARAIDLLRILIEHRPRVVNKRDLYDALWPDTFVADSSLPVLVREIRMTLAESRDAIRTVHGFGYAFGAPVRESRGPAISSPGTVVHLVRYAEHLFPLSEGRNIIGRDPAAAVFIASSSVSRQHAVITVEDERATIEDLGSKNGTRVDGRVIEGSLPLHPAAFIMVGTVELTYSRVYPNVETETIGG